MRKAGLVCTLLLCCNALVYSTRPIKGDLTFGLDVLFGLNGNTNRNLAGAIAHVGYDIFTPKIPYISIETKVGAGFFGGSLNDEFSTASLSNYKITCFTYAIDPKLHLSLNFDDTAFLFLENEFALSMLGASIQDREAAAKRSSQDLQFHYALKLGISFNVGRRQRLAIWVGGSTLDFDGILNKDLPAGRKRYSGEAPSYAAGIYINL